MSAPQKSFLSKLYFSLLRYPDTVNLGGDYGPNVDVLYFRERKIRMGELVGQAHKGNQVEKSMSP